LEGGWGHALVLVGSAAGEPRLGQGKYQHQVCQHAGKQRIDTTSACAQRSFAHHCVTAWHRTSDVLVAAATWKVPLAQAVTNAHSRSLVGVGGRLDLIRPSTARLTDNIATGVASCSLVLGAGVTGGAGRTGTIAVWGGAIAVEWTGESASLAPAVGSWHGQTRRTSKGRMQRRRGCWWACMLASSRRPVSWFFTTCPSFVTAHHGLSQLVTAYHSLPRSQCCHCRAAGSRRTPGCY